MQNLRIELYPEEVYIFTPKGEVKSLPRGATPVDFAYAMHTDVGHQCVGARVNGRMVPLRTRLNNGDIVEILTQTGHKPSRDWLNFVATSRARNKIKHFIHARGEGAQRRARPAAVRQGGAAVRRRQERSLTDEALAKIAGRVRRAEGRRSATRRSATARSPREPVLTRLVGQDALREKPPDGAIASVVRRVLGTGGRAARSRCAASTT